MKTIGNKKTTAAMLAATVLFVSTRSAFAYPPENAAVLYYQACMLYEVDSEMSDMLNDLRRGRIEPNERIEEFLKQNRRIISFVLDASEVKDCDWGIDYSQGPDALMPPLSQFRRLSFLTFADAKTLAHLGEYKAAFGRCVSVYRMARHINERLIISYLIGLGLSGATNSCISQILSDMPQDIETLTWLRNQLVQIDSQPLSVKPALRAERDSGTICMSPEKIGAVVRSGLDDGPFKKIVLKRILAADEQFFSRNKEYWNGYMDAVEAAFDLPYPQGYAEVKRLDEELTREFDEDLNATLTAGLAPTWHKIYIQSIGLGTHFNAVRAAIDIYILKAKKGKLPDTLPAGLPTDMFSGRPFQYEKTAGGFILRCRDKDGRDRINEYEFKVKK
jgi:hypothetical protein